MQRLGDIASMVQGFGKVSKSMVQVLCDDTNHFLKCSSVASSIVNKFETVSFAYLYTICIIETYFFKLSLRLMK